ncbi:MAG: hypothetical protein IPH33_19495 [Bacteroidetes bacterium]|nr:hypothetical protein [Bacteroidota bacterium]
MIIFQIGNGNTWVDSYRYIISYDTFGIRDSLATQIRDSLNILWVDDAKFNYDSADNYYVHMPSVKLVYDSGQSQYFTDSTYIVLDTFNLVRSSYHMFDRQQITQYYIYDYFHERQVIIYSNTNDWVVLMNKIFHMIPMEFILGIMDHPHVLCNIITGME